MRNWTLKGIAAGKATTDWPYPDDLDNGQERMLGFPKFDPSRCETSCQACIDICPTAALSTNRSEDIASNVQLDFGKCINCQICIETCPTDALQNSADFMFAAKNRNDLIRSQQPVTEAADRLRSKIEKHFKGSLHVRHIDAGSCNGCESELAATTNPYYNLHRLGIFFTPSPRFADVLLVTGTVVPQMIGPLQRTYQAMPNPKFVIAGGTCSISGAPFDFGYAAGNGADPFLPVDVYLPGCPPSPASFIFALLLLTERVEQKLKDGNYE